MDYLPIEPSDETVGMQSDLKLEKQKLKETGNYIGIGIILYLILTMCLMVIIKSIYVDFGLYDMSKYSKDFSYIEPNSYFFMVSITTIVSMLISFYIVIRLSKLKFSDVLCFQKLESSIIWSWIAIGLAATVCANFMATLLNFNLKSIGIIPDLPSSPYANGLVPFLLNIVALAIVPALMEEFVFRGVILGMLRKFGDGFAVLVSAAIFGLVHGNIIQSVFAFVVGLALGYIVTRTNSLVPGIIIHFINNFRSLIITAVSYNLSENAQLLVEEVSSILFVLLGILSLIYLLKKDKNMFLISESCSSLSITQRLNCVTANVGMIISLILCVLMMIV